MKRVLNQALAILLLAAALGAAPVVKNSSGSNVPHGQSGHNRPFQVGKASWYGKSFDGRDTASGEPYDMFRFTAAHLTLPLGTLVRVTNLRNGDSVVVKINDRGPMVPGRIIDLSYGAAQMLGLRAHGVETVRLDVVRPQTEVVARNDLPAR